MCAHLAPDLITLDRWGCPIIPTRVLNVEEISQATKAVKGCPKKALHLIADKYRGSGSASNCTII